MKCPGLPQSLWEWLKPLNSAQHTLDVHKGAYRWCAQIVYTDSVYKRCAQMVYIGRVHRQCVQAVCTGSVYRRCTQAVCTGYGHKRCIQAVCTGSVYRWCPQAMCTSSVHRQPFCQKTEGEAMAFLQQRRRAPRHLQKDCTGW